MSTVGPNSYSAARLLLNACLLAASLAAYRSAYAADEAPANTATASSPISSTAVSSAPINEALVIGFMGGFVSRNAGHHAEVKLLQSMREEYPSNVSFSMYENRRQREAYAMIREHLDLNRDGQLSPEEKSRAHILLFGHSWGASAVIALARRLNREGIPVALTVQVDSVAKPFHNDSLIPANVSQAVNFYQTHGWVHGRSRITAADPGRTKILGNFRFDYKDEPVAFRAYPWMARRFMKGHIEIESDPQVWSQVETLLRSQLPGKFIAADEKVPPNSNEQSLSVLR
jgi:pimeloyl-ACP methyl ester carboxylesterase